MTSFGTIQYRLRQAVFRLLLKMLSPILPWLVRRPWAWRLKAALFHAGSDQSWLARYGPDWDAPQAPPARPLGLIADLRGADSGSAERLLADLAELSPPPDVLVRLTENSTAGEIIAQLGPALLRPEAACLYLTARCRPHRRLTAHYATAMAAHPEARLWYSDEAQTAPDGAVKVFCKPAWDPLYYTHSGYVGQCFALGGELAAEVLEALAHGDQGRPPALPPASAWFDLALTLMDGQSIGHIPVPLYTSPAEDFPSPRPAARAAAPSGSQPKTSIVIPFKDRLDLLRPCLSTLLEVTDYPDFEIILVNNGSRETDTLDFLGGPLDSRLQVVNHDIPFNFSALVNRGVAAASGRVVVLLNSDITIISPHWLSALVRWAVRPQVGAVGAKLLYPNGLVQHGGAFSGVGLALGDGPAPPGMAHAGWPGDSKGYFGLLDSPRVMSSVTGAALAVRRELYEELGGFDEELAVAMNDVDFCLKAWKKGAACVWTPESVLIHHESASRQMDRVSADKMSRLTKEWALMRVRWPEDLGIDPWYSPNLSPESSYELRSPPADRRPRLLPALRL